MQCNQNLAYIFQPNKTNFEYAIFLITRTPIQYFIFLYLLNGPFPEKHTTYTCTKVLWGQV